MLNRNKKSFNVPSLFYNNGRTLSNMKELAILSSKCV